MKSGLRIALMVLAAILAGIVVHSTDALGQRLALYDALVRWVPRVDNTDVVVVAIDERTLSALGQWPFPRHWHADLLDTLSTHNVRLIAFDVLFAESAREASDDEQLAASLRAANNVVLPMVSDAWQETGQLLERLPVPRLAGAAAAIGHAHVDTAYDGIVRGLYLCGGLGQPYWPHFSLAAAGQLAVEAPACDTTGQALNGSQLAFSHYRRVPFPAPDALVQHSYVDVLEGRVPAGSLTDKAVFVGMTASGLGDRHATPSTVSGRRLSGVELNASSYAAIVRGRLISLAPDGLAVATTALVLTVLLAVFSVAGLLGGLVAAAIAASGLLAGGLVSLIFGYWIDVSFALTAVILIWGMHAVLRMSEAASALLRGTRALERVVDQTRVSRSKVDLDQVACYFRDVLKARAAAIVPGSASDNVSGNVSGNGQSGWHHSADYSCLQLADGSCFQVQWDGNEQPSRARSAMHYMERLLDASRHSRGLDYLQRQILSNEQAAAAVVDAQQYLERTLSEMREGVIIIDPLGQITYGNSLARSMLRCEIEADRHYLNISGLRNLLEDDISAALTGAPSTSRECVVDERTLLVGFAPMREADGELLSLVVTLTDVSALKRAERERAESLAFISHDLRSPIVSVLSLTRKARAGATPELRDLLDEMELHARRSVELSDDFLQLTRMEGPVPLEFNEFECGDLLQNVNAQVHSSAAARSIHIRVEEPEAEDGLWVSGHAESVDRALVNLASNAIKYSGRGTTVSLRCYAQDGFACFEVSDQGVGIPEQDQQKIFEPYYRVSGSDKLARGTGLGLRFVKAVAQRHKGAATVRSKAGEGSVFSLRLPLASE